eukprot:573434-Lingulodinium_polyedra.AAC.1
MEQVEVIRSLVFRPGLHCCSDQEFVPLPVVFENREHTTKQPGSSDRTKKRKAEDLPNPLQAKCPGLKGLQEKPGRAKKSASSSSAKRESEDESGASDEGTTDEDNAIEEAFDLLEHVRMGTHDEE